MRTIKRIAVCVFNIIVFVIGARIGTYMFLVMNDHHEPQPQRHRVVAPPAPAHRTHKGTIWLPLN